MHIYSYIQFIERMEKVTQCTLLLCIKYTYLTRYNIRKYIQHTIHNALDIFIQDKCKKMRENMEMK